MVANECLNELQDYMFSGKNLVKYLKTANNRIQMNTLQYKKETPKNGKHENVVIAQTENIYIPNQIPIPNPNPNPKKDDIFIPKEKDQLFWCYFVMKNGFSTYEYPNTTSFVNEKAIKIKCIDDLRLHKQQLKNQKIRNIKEICEDELVNKEQISIKTFTALCVIANINFLYIENRKCFPFICEQDETVNIIRKNGNHYSCEMNVSQEKIQDYMTKYFIVDNIEKPLKAMSSYKSQELIDLCSKLEILLDANDKKQKITKQFMYEKLVQQLS
jgi:hypothetical protein